MYRLFLIVLVASVLAACGQTAPSAGNTSDPYADVGAATTAPAAGASDLRQITLAMSYIPNVQFAPYYVAQSKGYYADEGLDVRFDYNFENDVVQRVASWPDSDVAFATASGTSVLLARQQQLPVTSVMTLYEAFPVVFFSKSAVPLASAQDLVGKRIGIPGRFGETYYALLALLYNSGIGESDLDIQEIGFTQAQAVLEGNVDVAVGYAMNEPLFLREQGEDVNTLRVADIFPLASNGVIASDDLIAQDPDLVRAFVQATLRGLRDTINDPDAAFTTSMTQIPEVDQGNLDFQRKVLQESLPYWQSDKTDTEGLGYTDGATWQQTYKFMRDTGLLTSDVDATTGFTNDFIQ